MKRFGVMLDVSRNAVMKPEEVIRLAKILKSFGYNMLQLYMEDTYEVENEPWFGYMRGRYTEEELDRIVIGCEKAGLEVIPCIQTLAHLNQIFRWEKYEKIHDISDILLAGDGRTYKLIENMIKSVRKTFKSSYINIGMDEAYMLGLGKYFEKNGYTDRFEILKKHLDKVVFLCHKYGFKPIMWSDMFFRLSGNEDYYSENPVITKEAVEAVPEGVGLVYWDYYYKDKEIHDGMFRAHRLFKTETWFAGAAWTWMGFAPGNNTTLFSMQPAMLSAKEHGIENLFITMWGDDGKECSFYAALPGLYATRRFYDGVTDMEIIKKEFNGITGENFDDMANLDLPNNIGGNRSFRNISKHMLYNDPFNGVFDLAVKKGGADEYAAHALTLKEAGKRSKNYAYIFEELSALCDVLSVKYDLGYRLRKAYEAKDKEALQKISDDFSSAIQKLDVFYRKFSKLWYKENKPQGFDIQDIRLGGLMQRLKSCKKRLDNYISGEDKDIPELDEKLLPWQELKMPVSPECGCPHLNRWEINVSVNKL